MRSAYQEDLPCEIKVLSGKGSGSAAQVALLHHELYAKNAVIPFSLSLPVSNI
ncbi:MULTISPECIES: hypothetical protein [unclassified Pseudomonas]|uniref:hypothetical protein n=1 Tax=unclassified Pseudomonas TaxID=196821 RepID=UPI0015B6847D|nr:MULTISPECIES: hypothetical protein [unclassified Pseudomonas]